ncbi:MAG: hypothetical protein ABIN13_06515 [Mucilaginibacter sp.]
MTVENPMAYSFIMQDDIYLLNADKEQYTLSQEVIMPSALAEPEPVYTPVPPAPVVAPEPISFKYLGGNKKGFLVITHYPEQDFMYDKHLAALESTLTRLGFTRDDIAIVNRVHYANTDFDILAGFFAPKKLLILGKHAVPGKMEALELNKLKQAGTLTALLTFSFDEMMDSVEHKKAFWEQMKQL